MTIFNTLLDAGQAATPFFNFTQPHTKPTGAPTSGNPLYQSLVGSNITEESAFFTVRQTTPDALLGQVAPLVSNWRAGTIADTGKPIRDINEAMQLISNAPNDMAEQFASAIRTGLGGFGKDVKEIGGMAVMAGLGLGALYLLTKK